MIQDGEEKSCQAGKGFGDGSFGRGFR